MALIKLSLLPFREHQENHHRTISMTVSTLYLLMDRLLHLTHGHHTECTKLTVPNATAHTSRATVTTAH